MGICVSCRRRDLQVPDKRAGGAGGGRVPRKGAAAELLPRRADLAMANSIANIKMTNPIKGIVSKRRKRYIKDGFNLDLAYITDRLIAMGFPAEKLEGVYRNHIDEVYRFLEQMHKDHYKIYNLCSERCYDISKFHGRVVERFAFEDHAPPNIELIHPFCENVHKWLSEDSRNVAAVHCKAGKGRTGTMVCCYLLYSGQKATADEALKYYGNQRTHDEKGVTIPSQRRYVEYYAALVRDSLQYSATRVHIRELLMSPPPALNGGHCSLELTLSQAEPPLKAPSGCHDVRKHEGHIRMVLDQCTPLHGDVRVDVYNKPKMMRKEKLFHFWFNTFFVTNCVGAVRMPPHPDTLNLETFKLTLSKWQLDDAHKDKQHKVYSPDFKVELIVVKQPDSSVFVACGGGGASPPSSPSSASPSPASPASPASTPTDPDSDAHWDSGEHFYPEPPLSHPPKGEHFYPDSPLNHPPKIPYEILAEEMDVQFEACLPGAFKEEGSVAERKVPDDAHKLRDKPFVPERKVPDEQQFVPERKVPDDARMSRDQPFVPERKVPDDNMQALWVQSFGPERKVYNEQPFVPERKIPDDTHMRFTFEEKHKEKLKEGLTRDGYMLVDRTPRSDPKVSEGRKGKHIGKDGYMLVDATPRQHQIKDKHVLPKPETLFDFQAPSMALGHASRDQEYMEFTATDGYMQAVKPEPKVPDYTAEYAFVGEDVSDDRILCDRATCKILEKSDDSSDAAPGCAEKPPKNKKHSFFKRDEYKNEKGKIPKVSSDHTISDDSKKKYMFFKRDEESKPRFDVRASWRSAFSGKWSDNRKKKDRDDS